jgi:DNA-directed RNA polymerase specialized sigma24 family protein
MHLDKRTAAGATPLKGMVGFVVRQAGVAEVQPAHLSADQLVRWASALVRVAADRAFPPKHMTREDLEQDAWVGILEGIRTFDASRGTFRHWVARHALQRVYDAVRWASRHSDELEATSADEAADLLEDLSSNPEQVMLYRRPRERVAYHAAKRLHTLSPAARALLQERLRGITADGTPEDRWAARGFDGEVTLAARQLRLLGLAAMKETVLENSVLRAHHRRP